jgi:hypothetical protein
MPLVMRRAAGDAVGKWTDAYLIEALEGQKVPARGPAAPLPAASSG